MKSSCYCEIEFLKEFANNIPKANPLDNKNDFEIWRNFKRLIWEISNLIVDDRRKLFDWVNELESVRQQKYAMNEALPDEVQNEYILATSLCKKKQVDSVEQNELLINEINFETINPHTVFFLTDTQKCKQFEEDYGMMFVSNSTKDDSTQILFGYEQSVISITPNGNYSNYSFLDKYHHPCNAMIINDAYVLTERDDTYEDNLIAILDLLLPLRLNKTTFKLLILSGDGFRNIDVNHKYSIIKSKIDELRTYKIELKIITKKAHHNRDILTNYLRISVGNKFTLFISKKASISDDLTVHSIIGIDSEMIVATDRKKDYKKIENETQDIGTQKVVMPKEQGGIITNRLLK